jgi:NAD(P)H-flavin reductase
MNDKQLAMSGSPKMRQKKNAFYTRMKKITYSKIIDVIHLTESTYVVRLEKNDFEFKAGQYLVLNVPGKSKAREYSIYSSENAPTIDLLIKEVTNGEVSKELKQMKPGTKVEISGPFGFFVLRYSELNDRNHFIFVATGTGISPFHSMVLSNPDLRCEVIHGIQHGREAYGSEDYREGSYLACTSRDQEGDYHGRVTQYLRMKPVSKDSLYYLCGNSGMVHEVTQYLEDEGVAPQNIRTEVFF